MIVTGGVVLVVLAAWYAKNKVTAIGGGIVDGIGSTLGQVVSDIDSGAKEALSPLNAAIREFDALVDGPINSVGAWFSGNPDWTWWRKPQDGYVLDPKNVEGW